MDNGRLGCFRFLAGIGQQRDTRGEHVRDYFALPHAKAFPIIFARYPGETFINFVTERANGFRSSGRTLSITGTSPGANSISHSHPFSSNSTIFTASTLLSPWRCSIPSASNALLRARYLPLPPSTQPPPLALSLALFRKFSPEPRSDCAARDYHMN